MHASHVPPKEASLIRVKNEFHLNFASTSIRNIEASCSLHLCSLHTPTHTWLCTVLCLLIHLPNVTLPHTPTPPTSHPHTFSPPYLIPSHLPASHPHTSLPHTSLPHTHTTHLIPSHLPASHTHTLTPPTSHLPIPPYK